MKIINALIAVVLLSTSALAGGFKMGLGNAAADTASAVYEKAAVIDQQNAVGDNIAAYLPSCGNTTPFTVSPIALSDIQGIEPLGHVNPPGHTLPSDHIYFYITPVSTTAPSGARVTTNLIAPGEIHISNIAYAYANNNTANTDYAVYFYPCRELKGYLTHIKSLSSTIVEKLNQASQSCYDYTTGGATFHRCDAATNISVSAGEVIGTVGGNIPSFDFGAYDYRRTPLAFLSPTRHYAAQAFTVCPLDYFDPAIKATLDPHVGRWDGGVQRVATPICGEILYDVANTASGDWYHVGSPDSPEDPHLALITDNVYPARQTISYGTSLPGLSSSFYSFDPLSSGTHNRNFSQVTSDGQVYCYDTFYDPVGQAAVTGFSLLLTMPTSSTLRMEKYNAASCGAGPWTMGSSYGNFQR